MSRQEISKRKQVSEKAHGHEYSSFSFCLFFSLSYTHIYIHILPLCITFLTVYVQQTPAFPIASPSRLSPTESRTATSTANIFGPFCFGAQQNSHSSRRSIDRFLGYTHGSRCAPLGSFPFPQRRRIEGFPPGISISASVHPLIHQLNQAHLPD